MRKSLTLICVVCCLLAMSRKCTAAQTLAKSGQICSPAMLDVSALPSPPSFTYGGHLFVLEVQNISTAACTLPPIEPSHVFLLPGSNTNNQPFYSTLRSDDPGHATESHAQVLESGAWAHVLFVWTSRAAPEQSCDIYSGIRLGSSFLWQQRNEPGIEIRNLWIRACGPLAVTGYRMGRYSSASPIPQSWIDWYGPDGLRGFTVPAPTPSTEIATPSPLLSLNAQAKRMMLGDQLFALRLDFPRLAAEGCSFSQLRKRESEGSTVIEIQECDAVPDKGAGPPAVPPHHEAGVMELWMSDGNLDFMPAHTGPFEYDVIAPIGWGSGKKPAAQYARARIDLVARDPSLPKQVAILDALPACAPTQLRVDSLPPVVSMPQKALRAYNVTNISASPCSLAGVPRMRGLDEKGSYQPFLPPVCPNCENELFMPRANGRIDLSEGASAHLLVASSGKVTGYCTFTPKLELSLDRDATLTASGSTGPQPKDIAQSVEVPFGGQDCVSIDISAWRQGRYDGDPLNSHQAELAHASESIPKPAVPAECNKPQLLVHGWPYPIEGTHDPDYALSMEQHQFLRDDPVPLYLWTNNSTDHSLELGGCNRPAVLKAGGYVLYDAYGHRILDKRQIVSDERCKADPSGYVEPLNCTATVFWSLPPHTCIVSPIDLAKLYDLPPGEYTISTRDQGDSTFCPRRGEKPYEPNPAMDIHFSVSQP
jgi:hypothetical protein